jgi:hypothetical protein
MSCSTRPWPLHGEVFGTDVVRMGGGGPGGRPWGLTRGGVLGSVSCGGGPPGGGGGPPRGPAGGAARRAPPIRVVRPPGMGGAALVAARGARSPHLAGSGIQNTSPCEARGVPPV